MCVEFYLQISWKLVINYPRYRSLPPSLHLLKYSENCLQIPACPSWAICLVWFNLTRLYSFLVVSSYVFCIPPSYHCISNLWPLFSEQNESIATEIRQSNDISVKLYTDISPLFVILSRSHKKSYHQVSTQYKYLQRIKHFITSRDRDELRQGPGGAGGVRQVAEEVHRPPLAPRHGRRSQRPHRCLRRHGAQEWLPMQVRILI